MPELDAQCLYEADGGSSGLRLLLSDDLVSETLLYTNAADSLLCSSQVFFSVVTAPGIPFSNDKK